MMGRLVLWGGLSFFALIVLVTGYNLLQPTEILRNVPIFSSPGVMDSIPGLEEKDLQSKMPIFVNFWASWCPPCLAEMPMLYALSDVMKVVGILFQDTPENAHAFLEQGLQPFSQIGNDPKGTIAISWGVINIPASFLILDGKIIVTFQGPLDFESISHIKKIVKRIKIPPKSFNGDLRKSEEEG